MREASYAQDIFRHTPPMSIARGTDTKATVFESAEAHAKSRPINGEDYERAKRRAVCTRATRGNEMTGMMYYAGQILPLFIIAVVVIASIIRFVEIEVAYRKLNNKENGRCLK